MSLSVILHVEDDSNWVDNVKRVLKDEENLILVNAKTADEAKRVYGDLLLNQHIPEIVILDISLVLEDKSDRGGINFAEELISWGFTDKTSIIILSDNVNIENLLLLFRNYKFKVEDVFRKGEFIDELDRFLKTVQRCLHKSNSIVS
jgi:hypothetical protein